MTEGQASDSVQFEVLLDLGPDVMPRAPPPERRVEEGDRTVGRVHGSNQVEVRGHAEAFAGVGQRHFEPLDRPAGTVEAQALVALEKRDEFVEDLRDVAAVDLVNEKSVPAGWIPAGSLAQPAENAAAGSS